MTTHCMLDLETLSATSDALILSIGATKFDPAGDGILDSIHIGIDINPLPSKLAGFTISPSTVAWWMHNDRQAGRDALADVKKTDLLTALDGFGMWLGPDCRVWGNGASFDNVILRHAYEVLSLDCPWNFWNDRCYHTFKNLAPSVKFSRVGAHHSALDDAISQTLHMQEIVEHLGLQEID